VNGVEALRAVLVADGPLTVMVPAVSIVQGPLGKGITPGISLESLSVVDLNIPAPGTFRWVRERVQATVVAPTNDERTDILRALKKAGADKRLPTVAGLTGVTIHTDGKGPDFMIEDPQLYLGSQDFMVKYNEER
jgi:hypothetical protein